MSKYVKLYEFISNSQEQELFMSFKEIEKIIGFKLDHSFLKYKKELEVYGYKVNKIYLKEEKVHFVKIG